MTHVLFLVAGVTVKHPEQIVLGEIIRGARLFRGRLRGPESVQTLLGRRRRPGGGGPLAGGAAEVRRQRTGCVFGHYGGQLLRFGVRTVTGQRLAQVRQARGAQYVFLQDRGVLGALAEVRRGSAVQAERQMRPGVRHHPTEGLERVEEVMSPREEVHVEIMGARERARVETPCGAPLQHSSVVTPVLQHNRDAGQGHGHDSTVGVEGRFKQKSLRERKKDTLLKLNAGNLEKNDILTCPRPI